MLTDPACERIARLLTACREEGRQIDHLPEADRPATRAEGYRAQAALEAFSRHAVQGWKIAATSKAGQAHINVDGPLAGRIFRERLLRDGDSVPLRGNNMRVAELEFAFRLGRDLPPRSAGYSQDEVRGAVAALHPAIEIPASRFTDFCAVGAPALIADNSCGYQFLFGEAFAPEVWRNRDLKTWEVEARLAGKGSFYGIGSNVLGDPWLALEWLVGECSAHGMALTEGQFISTGTCLVPVALAEGDALEADFGAGEPLRLAFV